VRRVEALGTDAVSSLQKKDDDLNDEYAQPQEHGGKEKELEKNFCEVSEELTSLLNSSTGVLRGVSFSPSLAASTFCPKTLRSTELYKKIKHVEVIRSRDFAFSTLTPTRRHHNADPLDH